MFFAGDTIVYPLHGIGKIMEVTEDGCYEIYVEEEDIMIKVSKYGAQERGVRYPLNKEELLKQIQSAKITDCADSLPWAEKRKEDKESLRSGEIRRVASVILRIEAKAKEKPLSAEEIRILHLARQIIQSEIRFVLEIDEKKAKELLANLIKC